MKVWQQAVGLFVLGLLVQYFVGPLLVGEQRTGWLQYRENIYVMLWFFLGFAWRGVLLRLNALT
jgi:hypothetical protein